MNKIFYIMGKSSSGKDTIYKKIFEIIKENSLNIKPLIISTTRPIRQGEQNGIEYYFKTKNEFEKDLLKNDVLEYRVYNTVNGEWIYYTSKNSIDLESSNYLGIGTLDSYKKLKEVYKKQLIPIYINVSDDIRLMRSIKREQFQKNPNYEEICRRFLSDSKDFSEEKLKELNIEAKYCNDTSNIEKVIEEIMEDILKYL